jgi:mercuric ion transport protein
MKISSLRPIIVSLPSAIVASLCCVLPLVVILLGIGSGAFMMSTMKYRYIFIPVGVIGVGLGYFFYFREKRKCDALACRMAAGRFNLIVLIMATVVVAIAILFDLLPGLIAPLLTGDS